MTAPIIPQSSAASSHGLVLYYENNIIGGVNSFTPNQNRQVTELYEFGNVSGVAPVGRAAGMPFDLAPGNISGNTIEFRRWDLFNSPFERAAPGLAIGDLGRQTAPAQSMRLIIHAPNPRDSIVRTYHNLWQTNRSRTLEAGGDRTVNVGGTFAYLYSEDELLAS